MVGFSAFFSWTVSNRWFLNATRNALFLFPRSHVLAVRRLRESGHDTDSNEQYDTDDEPNDDDDNCKNDGNYSYNDDYVVGNNDTHNDDDDEDDDHKDDNDYNDAIVDDGNN